MDKQAKGIAPFEACKLIVTFRPNVTPEEKEKVHALLGGTVVKQLLELNVDIISVQEDKEKEYQEKYLAQESVLAAELDHYAHLCCRPNDPYYNKKLPTLEKPISQWGLRRINAESAWDYVSCFTPVVKIAVIDSGIDPDHPDLVGKYVEGIGLINADDYKDINGHGTFIAGIAAAMTNNGIGIAGVSYNCAYIIPIKTGYSEEIPISILVEGILYAVAHGAQVINMSFATVAYFTILQNAVDYAWEKGVVCIAGAANNGSEEILYPAGHLHVLAVGAINQFNESSDFSNWGIDIGIVAPGSEIISTTPTYPCELGYLPYYDVAEGTSYATPFVCGVAAMMLAVNPRLTNEDVVRILQQTAVPLQGECCKAWNVYYGYGLLNAGEAVRMARCYPYGEFEGVGSFYGQVVDKVTGMPVVTATVAAVKEGVIVRQYKTKTTYSLFRDGMFRLRNLGKGEYKILVDGIEIQTVSIIPGTDVHLRLMV